MKRTLLAVGIAVLLSMMLVSVTREVIAPIGAVITVAKMRPFFFLFNCGCDVLWTPFALQTAFAAVAAAVIVNLFPRKPKT